MSSFKGNRALAIDALRKKLAMGQGAGVAASGPPPEGGEKLWPVALARAMRDVAGLAVDMTQGRMHRMSLGEVLDLPMTRALILMLQGPSDASGLLVLSPEVLASTVETLTLGRSAQTPPEMRRPSRTDAAMIWPLADLALMNLGTALDGQDDARWASGFQAASFVEEARPLALLLDDVVYRVLTLDLSLALGARQGVVHLVLPADGTGARHVEHAPATSVEEAKGADFAVGLAAQVELAECCLDAVVGRIQMTLAEAMTLCVGATLPLMSGGLDCVSLEGLDGRRLAEGKLGQLRGMRAFRVMTPAVGATVPTPRGATQGQPPRTAAMEKAATPAAALIDVDLAPPPLAATGTG